MSFLAKAARLLDVAKRNLGEIVLYRHRDGGEVEIEVIWNGQYAVIDPSTQAFITSNDPNIGVILSDLLDAPKQDDIVEFMNVQYKVVDIQEDGQGAAQIFLYKL